MKNGFSKQFAWAQLPPVGKLISSSAQKGAQRVCVPKKRRKAVETLPRLLPEHRRQRRAALQWEARLTRVWEFKLHWSLQQRRNTNADGKRRASESIAWRPESSGSWIKVYLILLLFDFHGVALYWKHLSLYPLPNLTITAIYMISALYSDEELQLKWNEIWAHLYQSTSTHTHTRITTKSLC